MNFRNFCTLVRQISDLNLHRSKTLVRNVRCVQTQSLEEPLPEAPPAKPLHVPVMLQEVMEHLRGSSVVLDMTFGGGGHSRALLEASEDLRIIALDRDPTAHNLAKLLQEEYPGRVLPLLGRFSDLPHLLRPHLPPEASRPHWAGLVDGALMDLGASSMQFDTAERGFMLSRDGPLDMRMGSDPQQPTAAQCLAHLDEDQLYKGGCSIHCIQLLYR